MSNDQELRSHLEGLGRQSGPAVDPSFADGLDAQLRVARADQHGAVRGRVWWLAPLVGVAAAALVVVALFLGPRPPELEVVMTAAADTQVIVPGGVSSPAVAGQRLPDGTRIMVGPDGEAVVDGVVLGPGSTAVVVGDRLDVLIAAPAAGGAAPAGEGPADEGTQAPGGETDRAETDGGTDVDRDGAREPDPSTVPPTSEVDGTTPRPTSTPPPTTAPGATSTTSPSTSTTRASTSAPGSTDDPPTSTATDPAALVLRVTPARDGRLRLTWTAAPDLPTAGWRVSTGRGDRVATLVVIRSADARSTTIEQQLDPEAVLWVEALDGEGGVLATSAPVPVPPS
ncbi:MAG: hypothetical protein AAFN30_05805 [Actinomycetota bacterium]